MKGHLYAVIFEQGTVKVGMTTRDPKYRLAEHKGAGLRWGVAIHKHLVMAVNTNDLEFRENVLRGYCMRSAIYGVGYEWMRFETASAAEEVVENAFKKISNNEFEAFGPKNGMAKEWKEIQMKTACEFVEQGMNGPEAAIRVGLSIQSFTKTKKYKSIMEAKKLKEMTA